MTNSLAPGDLFTRVVAAPLCLISLASCFALNGCEKTSSKPVTAKNLVAAKKTNHVNPPAEPSDLPAAELYNIHCAACHHESGNGEGPGAQSVYPLPRNFRKNKFRMVSHLNRLPDVDDIQRVIDVGMPGTSMQAFGMLHESDRRRMAQHVLVLWRAGMAEQIRAEYEHDHETIEPAELQSLVIASTTATDPVKLPDFGEPTTGSIQRGKQLYASQGCQSCHGASGIGVATIDLVDEDHQPVRPRDLVHEPMKGGDSPGQLYYRILLGMPGTPHPSSQNLSPAQIADMIHYLQSIGREEKIILTGHQRRVFSSSEEYMRQVDGLVGTGAKPGK